MAINPTVKNILVITAKNAVFALMTNGGLGVMMPATFNFSHAGLIAYAKAAGAAVAARELLYWGPKVYNWAKNVPNGN